MLIPLSTKVLTQPRYHQFSVLGPVIALSLLTTMPRTLSTLGAR